MHKRNGSQLGIDTSWFRLGLRSIVLISIYYAALLLVSLAYLIVRIINSMVSVQFDYSLAFLGGLAASVVGCSIYYTRKLYKLSLNRKEQKVKDDNSGKIIVFGALMYFISRPFFAIGFSILTYLGIRAGFLLVASGPITPSSGLAYVNMFLSFFVGFSCGGLIDILEKTGVSFLQGVFIRQNSNTKD